MKNYTIKNLISVICLIMTGFCASIALLCVIKWSTVFYAILGSVMSVLYLIMGILIKKDANEDYEYYLSKQEEIKEIYKELSYMYKKYYWALDVDSLVPSLKNKKNLLAWAADTAVACLVYQHDYKTAELDSNADTDLNIIINLAQDLIDNKKYL